MGMPVLACDGGDKRKGGLLLCNSELGKGGKESWGFKWLVSMTRESEHSLAVL
jgi:hypothetical protein